MYVNSRDCDLLCFCERPALAPVFRAFVTFPLGARLGTDRGVLVQRVSLADGAEYSGKVHIVVPITEAIVHVLSSNELTFKEF